MSLSVNLKFIVYLSAFSLLAILILGIPTAVIRNHFYFRMTPAFWFDYLFLVVNGTLIGLYFAITYTSTQPEACKIEKKSLFASVLALFGIACPICNQILLLIFSTSFLLSFLGPIRPFISLTSALSLIWLVYKKLKIIRQSKSAVV